MNINLTCACSAHIEISDPRGTYVNQGGSPNAEGRIFQIELVADRWLREHSAHAPKRET